MCILVICMLHKLQIFYTLTESLDICKFSTGLFICSILSSEKLSNDHRHMVASRLPETSTSLAVQTLSAVTAARCCSIFVTNFPVSSRAMTMVESSAPLIINDLFIEHVTHRMADICSLQYVKTVGNTNTNTELLRATLMSYSYANLQVL